MGRKETLTKRQLEELADFLERSDDFNDLKKTVLGLAAHVTRTPPGVPDAVFNALQLCFTPQQLGVLTSAIALENYRARFDRAFDAKAEKFMDGGACAVLARTHV